VCVCWTFYADENYMENDAACLTTTGDIFVLSLPNLRQQMKVEGIKCDNRYQKKNTAFPPPVQTACR